MKQQKEIPSPVGRRCIKCDAKHLSDKEGGGKVILTISKAGVTPKFLCQSCGMAALRALTSEPLMCAREAKRISKKKLKDMEAQVALL